MNDSCILVLYHANSLMCQKCFLISLVAHACFLKENLSYWLSVIKESCKTFFIRVGGIEHSISSVKNNNVMPIASPCTDRSTDVCVSDDE